MENKVTIDLARYDELKETERIYAKNRIEINNYFGSWNIYNPDEIQKKLLNDITALEDKLAEKAKKNWELKKEFEEYKATKKKSFWNFFR